MLEKLKKVLCGKLVQVQGEDIEQYYRIRVADNTPIKV